MVCVLPRQVSLERMQPQPFLAEACILHAFLVPQLPQAVSITEVTPQVSPTVSYLCDLTPPRFYLATTHDQGRYIRLCRQLCSWCYWPQQHKRQCGLTDSHPGALCSPFGFLRT